MKVSHRHQVHVQLTGREADLLLGVFYEFAESSRMDNLLPEQTELVSRFVELLAENDGEDA